MYRNTIVYTDGYRTVTDPIRTAKEARTGARDVIGRNQYPDLWPRIAYVIIEKDGHPFEYARRVYNMRRNQVRTIIEKEDATA